MTESLQTDLHSYDHGCLVCPLVLAHDPEFKRVHIRDEGGRCFAEICSKCVSIGWPKILKELKKQTKRERNHAARLLRAGGEVRYIKDSVDCVELREFLVKCFRFKQNWLDAVQPGKDSLSEQNDDRNK